MYKAGGIGTVEGETIMQIVAEAVVRTMGKVVVAMTLNTYITTY